MLLLFFPKLTVIKVRSNLFIFLLFLFTNPFQQALYRPDVCLKMERKKKSYSGCFIIDDEEVVDSGELGGECKGGLEDCWVRAGAEMHDGFGLTVPSHSRSQQTANFRLTEINKWQDSSQHAIYKEMNQRQASSRSTIWLHETYHDGVPHRNLSFCSIGLFYFSGLNSGLKSAK